MTSVAMHAGMDLPSLPVGHRVQALLHARLRTQHASARADAPHAHWSPAFFGLDKVSVFAGATDDAKARVLDACGRGLLEEAYFIEKSGIGFAAEMVLLSRSIEERMLYALFGAEEARHFDDVRSFLAGAPPSEHQNPFLALLSETIECADRTALQFVIQIVLEGWGLTHYRALRDGCLTPALRESLDAILRDEAGHHGSGRVLFAEAEVSEQTAARIGEVLGAMLRMVQQGPQGVLAGLEAGLGHLSRAQKLCALRELDAAAHAQARLDQLRQLVRFESVRSVVEHLEAKKLFQSSSPQECL